MTRVVIVGEIYNADLSIGGGPVIPGRPGGPVDPGWGWGGPGHPSGQPVPPGGPVDPGYGRPGWGPVDPGFGWGGGEHPGNRPPYGGGHPSQGPIYGGGHPSGGPIVPPQGGTEVPEDEYQPTPPPESITSQYIVSVWDPKTMTWTTKTYPPR
jgi:hypothetical protein